VDNERISFPWELNQKKKSVEADKLPPETKPKDETGVVDNEKKTEQVRQSGQPR